MIPQNMCPFERQREIERSGVLQREKKELQMRKRERAVKKRENQEGVAGVKTLAQKKKSPTCACLTGKRKENERNRGWIVK